MYLNFYQKNYLLYHVLNLLNLFYSTILNISHQIYLINLDFLLYHLTSLQNPYLNFLLLIYMLMELHMVKHLL